MLLVVAVVVLGSRAEAQAVYTHAIQEGDTLASVAQRYYGDPTREAVLSEANRMKGPDTNGLVLGSWIFIPLVTFYRVNKDETWEINRDPALWARDESCDVGRSQQRQPSGRTR